MQKYLFYKNILHFKIKNFRHTKYLIIFGLKHYFKIKYKNKSFCILQTKKVLI